MWTFTIKYQFAMSIKNRYLKKNWPSNKLNIWREFTKRSVEESIYKNFKTWTAAGTLTTSHHHRNRRLHLIAMTIFRHCHHPSHPSIYQEPLPRPCSTFKASQLGLCNAKRKIMSLRFTKIIFVFLQRTFVQEGRHNLYPPPNRQKLVRRWIQH